MATYHIKDDGMPGRCSAQSVANCPKSKNSPSGAAFHGTLEEATKESERRFEEKLGLFAAQELAANTVVSSQVESETITYRHPQGKTIVVKDGKILSIKDKNGRDATSSATADELANGYGRWAVVDRSSEMVSQVEYDAMPAKTNAVLRSEYKEAARLKIRAEQELRDARDLETAYDQQFGAEEGRAYTLGAGGKRIYSKDWPAGPGVYYDRRPESIEAGKQAQQKVRDSIRAEEDAQTAMEEAGLGHEIPDDGHTIRVANQAQKLHLRDELLGQISDGHWENSSNNPWQDWANATVIVDPSNVGRNFNTSRDSYQLNASSLMDVVGDRMIENVKDRTGDSDYNMTQMQKDLRELRGIFKTRRPVHNPQI
jgi:hypothetical protein